MDSIPIENLDGEIHSLMRKDIFPEIMDDHRSNENDSDDSETSVLTSANASSDSFSTFAAFFNGLSLSSNSIPPALQSLLIDQWHVVFYYFVIILIFLRKTIQNRSHDHVISALLFASFASASTHFFISGEKGVSAFCLFALAFYFNLPDGIVAPRDKLIFVTSVESGVGWALAKRLDNLGARVIAGCKSTSSKGARTLKQTCSSHLQLIHFDPESETSIDNAVKVVREKLTKDANANLHRSERRKSRTMGMLWGLANTHGRLHVGDVELTNLTLVQEQLNVNTVATLRVTQKFLPFLKESRGRVANLSASAAALPRPGLGSYSMTLKAVENMTHVLRQEMKNWGVDVCLVRSGTLFMGAYESSSEAEGRASTVWNRMDESLRNSYGMEYLESLNRGILQEGPKSVAEYHPCATAASMALFSKHPRPVYHADSFFNVLVRKSVKSLPSCIRDVVVTWMRRNDDVDSVLPKALVGQTTNQQGPSYENLANIFNKFSNQYYGQNGFGGDFFARYLRHRANNKSLCN